MQSRNVHQGEIQRINSDSERIPVSCCFLPRGATFVEHRLTRLHFFSASFLLVYFGLRSKLSTGSTTRSGGRRTRSTLLSKRIETKNLPTSLECREWSMYVALFSLTYIFSHSFLTFVVRLSLQQEKEANLVDAQLEQSDRARQRERRTSTRQRPTRGTKRSTCESSTGGSTVQCKYLSLFPHYGTRPLTFRSHPFLLARRASSNSSDPSPRLEAI